MRTLIIDPVAFQRRILALLLEARGMISPEQYAGSHAVAGELAADDLVFADARQVSSSLRPASIIVTGSEKADATLASAIDSGLADALLVKPYTEAALTMALDDLSLFKRAAATS